MRKAIASLAAFVFVAVSAAPLLAATETVTGKVVDHSCYMKDKASNAGNDHKMPADVAACATACAKNGRPMALLTSDGKVYTIAGDLAANKNAKLVAHVAHTVEITGDVTTKDGAMTISSANVKHVSQ